MTINNAQVRVSVGCFLAKQFSDDFGTVHSKVRTRRASQFKISHHLIWTWDFLVYILIVLDSLAWVIRYSISSFPQKKKKRKERNIHLSNWFKEYVA
jgi:hypothetical protein